MQPALGRLRLPGSNELSLAPGKYHTAGRLRWTTIMTTCRLSHSSFDNNNNEGFDGIKHTNNNEGCDGIKRPTIRSRMTPCVWDIYLETMVGPGAIMWYHSQHDDVSKWKHFQRNWPFVRGIHRSTVNSPHKDQWRGALMFSLQWLLSFCAENAGYVILYAVEIYELMLVMLVVCYKLFNCVSGLCGIFIHGIYRVYPMKYVHNF